MRWSVPGLGIDQEHGPFAVSEVGVGRRVGQLVRRVGWPGRSRLQLVFVLRFVGGSRSGGFPKQVRQFVIESRTEPVGEDGVSQF